ncbi:hypothetical protein FH972_022836 [Carpinus fangiana]|uniref:Isochorismatase-like domain-containing protein n=1 Tax=Carpinus fangiana TaxID=176857 RepID=A0A5N6KTF9_9ROSI|nr:hypothetical protein FH972_022836 [Carpinus fangiana]
MTRSALLVMDVQNFTIARVAAPPTYLTRLASTIASARAASIPVIYVVAQFRPGAPEAHARNRTFVRNPTCAGWIEGSASAAVHAAVAPQDGDVVVTKRRVSAFAGTDLEIVLRSLGVERVVVAGVATSGCVLSTVRQAADGDYGVVVVRDLCLDPDEEVQRVLMEKVFVKQAEVVDSEEWVAGLDL